jgi:polyisoprenoid-binding protein YceI
MEAIAVKTKWSTDPTHSEVQFKVKHLVISTVTGNFGQFQAEIHQTEDDFNNAEASFEAHIDSISTNLTDRDNHLKSADFFDAAQFPLLSYKSTKFTKINDSTYKIDGEMTIKGITKPVSLSAEYGGRMTDFYGNDKVGFEISGKINRQDFGLSWSAVTEAGGIVVSDEVRLALNLQFEKRNL